jgi:tetratricopeptide (TPR) repeat protein
MLKNLFFSDDIIERDNSQNFDSISEISEMTRRIKKIEIFVALIFLAAACFGQTNFERGEELFMNNRPAEALIFLENSIADDPSFVKAYLYLGIVYEQLNKLDEAIAVYRRILPRAGFLTPNVASNLGNVYFIKGEAASAETYYTQAIAYDMVYSPAWLGRANTRIMSGFLRNALSDYEEYISLEPRSPQRAKIEQLISIIRAEFAAEERRRLIEEEEERIRAEQRQRLLDEISASLQAAADSGKGLSSGMEGMEGYDSEFELE